jgi:hypothetical protein
MSARSYANFFPQLRHTSYVHPDSVNGRLRSRCQQPKTNSKARCRFSAATRYEQFAFRPHLPRRLSPYRNSPRNADSRKKENVTSMANGCPITPPARRKLRPIGAELRFHGNAGDYTQREVDAEDLRPEARRFIVGFVASADGERLEQDDQRRQTHRQLWDASEVSCASRRTDPYLGVTPGGRSVETRTQASDWDASLSRTHCNHIRPTFPAFNHLPRSDDRLLGGTDNLRSGSAPLSAFQYWGASSGTPAPSPSRSPAWS